MPSVLYSLRNDAIHCVSRRSPAEALALSWAPYATTYAHLFAVVAVANTDGIQGPRLGRVWLRSTLRSTNDPEVYRGVEIDRVAKKRAFALHRRKLQVVGLLVTNHETGKEEPLTAEDVVSRQAAID